jgi:phosphoribosyl-AMP cyclohydrolase / phosphoribosyl-ATP pyrophosphohydrolase
MIDLERLDFAKGGGLVPVIAQDAISGAVLMVAFADRTALERTLESGELHLFSRTRGPWKKGETSGNVLRVESLAADCDGDAVLARVHPAGPACHTGARSCFGEEALAADTLAVLDRVIVARAASPLPGSYTAELLENRNRRLKKIGEEAAELVAACADGNAAQAADEAADLLYHALVALRALGASWDDVRAALARRRMAGTHR